MKPIPKRDTTAPLPSDITAVIWDKTSSFPVDRDTVNVSSGHMGLLQLILPLSYLDKTLPKLFLLDHSNLESLCTSVDDL